MGKDTHIYIGTAKCGCNVGAVVDMVDHPERTNEWLAEFVRAGYTVSRHTIADHHEGKVKLNICAHAKQVSL